MCVCIYALYILKCKKELLQFRTCLRAIFGAGVLRNSKLLMNWVFVIASQVCCPVSCMLVVVQPHLQISLQPWDHVGLQKLVARSRLFCGISSAVSVLSALWKNKGQEQGLSVHLYEALGFSCEPAQGIASF